MAPQVPATEVHFYTSEDHNGSKHGYKVGDDVNLWPGALHDKFHSLVVGSDAKVLAWQHSNASGAFAELTGDVASLAPFVGGLSRFKVVDDDVRAIAFRFVDGTSTTTTTTTKGGKEPKQYSLKVDAADVDEKILFSEGSGAAAAVDVDVDVDAGDDGGDFQLVGILREDGPPVTTAVYVRDEKTGAYVAVGSVYFQWNAQDKQVDVVEDDNFPKQLSIERAGVSTFVVTLVSNEPST